MLGLGLRLGLGLGLAHQNLHDPKPFHPKSDPIDEVGHREGDEDGSERPGREEHRPEVGEHEETQQEDRGLTVPGRFRDGSGTGVGSASAFYCCASRGDLG